MVSALHAQRAGDLMTAERHYRDALDLDPDNIDALHMLGVVYFSMRSLDRAEPYIRKALSLSPTSGTAVKNISHNLMMLREALAAPGAPAALGTSLRVVRESRIADVACNVREIHPPEPVLLSRLEFPPKAVVAPGATAFRFPAIQAFELEDAVADPEGQLPTNDEVVVFPDFVDFRRHQLPELRYNDYAISHSQETAQHRRHWPDPWTGELPEAIVMTSGYWQNWAHFLTELLPRILFADSHEPWRGAPLVVSAIGLANAHSLCRRLIPGDREIVRLAGSCRIKRAGYVSSVGWAPYEYIYDTKTAIPPFQQNDTAFSAYALDRVRDAAHRLVGVPLERRATRRVYIRRVSKVRRTLNAERVEAAFLERGFAAVSPETLSVEEQIRLFSDAQVIAGQAGAGLANMIFAPPGCRILAYTAFTPHANWTYWPTVANALGHRLHYLFGQAIGVPAHPAHPDCAIDIPRIDEAMERLLGE
jgi:capsular polysaccharide biosynthesis protein